MELGVRFFYTTPNFRIGWLQQITIVHVDVSAYVNYFITYPGYPPTQIRIRWHLLTGFQRKFPTGASAYGTPSQLLMATPSTTFCVPSTFTCWMHQCRDAFMVFWCINMSSTLPNSVSTIKEVAIAVARSTRTRIVIFMAA